MKIFLSLVVFFIFQIAQSGEIVTIKNKKFYRHNQPYTFFGANFWQAAHLAAPEIGNLENLRKELDTLVSIGVTNIRVMALSEGPDTEPYRVTPSLQTAPGVYNEKLLIGLDHLLVELNKRKMTAVLVLGNFWPWSGGFAQWVSWFEGSSIPYPPPHPGGSWSVFQDYAAKFYANPKIQEAWLASIKKIITRKNSLTGKYYKYDPAIFSWELANEPRGGTVRPEFLKWIDASSTFIKSLDRFHLVTTGSEGATLDATSAGNNFYEDHNFSNIDYMTFHLWVENWGIYQPRNARATLITSIQYMKSYVDEHTRIANTLGKPIVLEEFGISRDNLSYDPNSTLFIRDQYFREVFDYSFTQMQTNQMHGVNFWAWSGASRPVYPFGQIWHSGDPLLGDPPHEHQGWYGIYDTDYSTLNIIREFNSKI